MKNIVLIGMMGCGKTTVGGLLSAKLNREQIDTDALIVEREGRAISAMFAEDGEAWFRTRELDISREVAGKTDLILSCGGGLPLQRDAMAALRESGVAFWLNRDPGETYDALDVSGRPLAQEGKEAFVARYTYRAPIYRTAAHHIIDCSRGAEAAAEDILRILEEEGYL